MPSYVKLLNDRQIWELSNLVKNADKPLPVSAQKLLVLDTPITTQ